MMTVVELFLIHRYKASAVHYLTPTEDNEFQTQKMKSLGIFSDVHTEVRQIIIIAQPIITLETVPFAVSGRPRHLSSTRFSAHGLCEVTGRFAESFAGVRVVKAIGAALAGSRKMSKSNIHEKKRSSGDPR